jgi:hypothetical protein
LILLYVSHASDAVWTEKRMTCHTLFVQTASDTWSTPTATEGRCFVRSDDLSEVDGSLSVGAHLGQIKKARLMMTLFRVTQNE